MCQASDRPQTRQFSNSMEQQAGQRLLNCYAELAQQKKHLLGDLLKGQAPRQWRHYPDNDAIDTAHGYQWFYHSHSPEDRPGVDDHGHFHLFARRERWSSLSSTKREQEFSNRLRMARRQANTRHLICIGLDAKGIPTRFFTVNSWVTGDLMLSAATTVSLLEQMALNTGFTVIDRVIGSMMSLFRREIRQLMAMRDDTLFSQQSAEMLDDENLEVLSEVAIDIDAKLAEVLG